MNCLTFKNLSCDLSGKEILKNLSGEIPPGKITALLGPNGCGKSTFLRALLGLIPFKAGKITWKENKIAGLLQSGVALGYMPQAKEIYWPLTCEAIINLGNQEPGTRNQEKTKKIMLRLGIEYLFEKRIDEVSGGERTLVLLARALVNQPEIIIADEPVAELDPAYQIQVMKILREEATRGAVVLITMHDINLSAKFCDEIFLMKEGQFVACGPAANILTTENLEAAFQISFLQVKGLHAQTN